MFLFWWLSAELNLSNKKSDDCDLWFIDIEPIQKRAISCQSGRPERGDVHSHCGTMRPSNPLRCLIWLMPDHSFRHRVWRTSELEQGISKGKVLFMSKALIPQRHTHRWTISTPLAENRRQSSLFCSGRASECLRGRWGVVRYGPAQITWFCFSSSGNRFARNASNSLQKTRDDEWLQCRTEQHWFHCEVTSVAVKRRSRRSIFTLDHHPPTAQTVSLTPDDPLIRPPRKRFPGGIPEQPLSAFQSPALIVHVPPDSHICTGLTVQPKWLNGP